MHTGKDRLIPIKQLVYKIKNELMDPIAKAVANHKEQCRKYMSAMSEYSSETEELLRKTITDLETKHHEVLLVQQMEFEEKINTLKANHEKLLSKLSDDIDKRFDDFQREQNERITEFKSLILKIITSQEDDNDDNENNSSDNTSNDSIFPSSAIVETSNAEEAVMSDSSDSNDLTTTAPRIIYPSLSD